MAATKSIVDPRRWVASTSTEADVTFDSSRVLSDGATGTGTIVHSTSPTISTPTITSPSVTGLSTDTLQTSGNAGFGGAPSATGGQFITITDSANETTALVTMNSNASGTAALAINKVNADTANLQFISHGSGRTASRYGVTLGGYSEIDNLAGNGLLIGTRTAKPLIIGTNSTNRLQIDGAGVVTIAGAVSMSSTLGVTGAVTGPSFAATGDVSGASVTIASGSAIKGHLSNTGSWTPGLIANNASVVSTLTVTGSALGDVAVASFSTDLLGTTIHAYVSSANTVTLVITNNTGGNVTLGAGTVRAEVWKH